MLSEYSIRQIASEIIRRLDMIIISVDKGKHCIVVDVGWIDLILFETADRFLQLQSMLAQTPD